MYLRKISGKSVKLLRLPSIMNDIIPDLKSEETRPRGSCDVSCLSGHCFRLAARKVEPVDEPPIERISECRKCIDVGRRDDEGFDPTGHRDAARRERQGRE
jgi:hypothetical protein